MAESASNSSTAVASSSNAAQPTGTTKPSMVTPTMASKEAAKPFKKPAQVLGKKRTEKKEEESDAGKKSKKAKKKN